MVLTVVLAPNRPDCPGTALSIAKKNAMNKPADNVIKKMINDLLEANDKSYRNENAITILTKKLIKSLVDPILLGTLCINKSI